MFNKKNIAVALAAAFSTSTFAAVNLDATTSQTVLYATEVVTATGPTAVAENAEVTVDMVTTKLLDITTQLGFTIGNGTSKYIRIDLNNATFGASADGALVVNSDIGNTADLSAGGSVGDDFVIYEVAATAEVGPTAPVVLSVDQYNISTTEASSVTYRLYETATAAATASSAALKTASSGFTDLTSVSTGEFAVATDNQATVASEFTLFGGASMGATTATVGFVDTDLLVDGSAYTLTGTLVTAADILATSQDVLLNGDLSFGSWTLSSTDDCGSTIYEFDETTGLTTTSVAQDDLDGAYVCVDADGDVIEKGSYSLTLVDDELTDGLGTITYDTTTIEVPYLTTFSEYNQRLYLINNGSSAADYSISFVGESMTTITPLAGAQGTVPAGEMLMLKVTDIVELEGRTRVSATVEVEGIDANIQAATQTVNLADGTTDTVVLNANSITSPSN